jgi:PST family polysaccharide transporter
MFAGAATGNREAVLTWKTLATKTIQYATPSTSVPKTLAQKTVSGFFWLLAQTVGSKLVNMVGQVVLAWLLSPADWGLVGLAYTVTAFASLIQQAGLREILIHRHEHFDRWANPAFWMSLALGCLGAAVMAGMAPIAAWMYEEPQLVGLVLVLAATAPFSGLDIVPDARLTSEMRFRYLAVVKWITAVGTMGLSIVFALMKLGPYSFVLPVPIITAVRLTLLWSATRPRIRWTPHLRRWKYLVNDSFMLLLAGFFIMLTWQGDYIVLGILHDAKTVGIYFFAFNLSIQTMQVFTSNLTGVLFPALSRLQKDPAHQTRAFLQAARILAIVGVPLCLLQAALAGPVLSMLFNSWWYPAIRVLQLLSIGMAVRLVASPGGSLIQAQGRFGVYTLTNGINAAFFIGLVALGAWFGQHLPPDRVQQLPRFLQYFLGEELPAAVLVALAVMIYFAAIGPIFLYVAIRPGGGRWRDVWRVYAPPAAAGVISIGIGVLFGRLIPRFSDARGVQSGYQAVRILVISAWAVAVYVPLIRTFAPDSFNELLQRISSLRGNRKTMNAPVPQTAN